MEVLTSTSRDGDFVHRTQTMAKDNGFRNVSQTWYDKTIDFDQGMVELEAGRAQTEDILDYPGRFIPVIHNDRVALQDFNGRRFTPTEHAMNQLGIRADTGTWLVNHLCQDKVTSQGKLLYKRDRQDAETLVAVLQNGLRRLNPNKKLLWRTRKDGTLRAVLTSIYAIIDNRWFLETLKELIPNGRLSHWRGDADTIWTNILIPDSIRQEKDSEYGGMLSGGNSEIGERNMVTLPSIFRSICMNGCIWGQTKGEMFRVVHRRKKIDYDT